MYACYDFLYNYICSVLKISNLEESFDFLMLHEHIINCPKQDNLGKCMFALLILSCLFIHA